MKDELTVTVMLEVPMSQLDLSNGELVLNERGYINDCDLSEITFKGCCVEEILHDSDHDKIAKYLYETRTGIVTYPAPNNHLRSIREKAAYSRAPYRKEFPEFGDTEALVDELCSNFR